MASHASALKHGTYKWRQILPKNQDATLASLRQLCHTKEQLEKFYFPLPENLRYAPKESGQDHLYIAEHCKDCGVSRQSTLDGSISSKQTCMIHPPQTSLDPCSHCQKSTKLSIGCQTSPHSHRFVEKQYDGFTRIYFDAPTTTSNPTGRRRIAVVALNCELVELAYGKEMVAKLSVIDFLTGEILIDSLVAPPKDERVTDWRTITTMIDGEKMMRAVRSGKALDGVAAARETLFGFIDKDTTIVGFDMRRCFEALRLRHANVVDYKTLYAINFREPFFENFTLQQVFQIYFVGAIQSHELKGKDTLAVREIILYWIEREGKMVILTQDEWIDEWWEHQLCMIEHERCGCHPEMFPELTRQTEALEEYEEYKRCEWEHKQYGCHPEMFEKDFCGSSSDGENYCDSMYDFHAD